MTEAQKISKTEDTKFKEINAIDLSLLIKADHPKIQLLDVRESFEREICHIGGIHIPLSTFNESIAKEALNKDQPVVVYCRSGGRSANVCLQLKKMGFSDVSNLIGGIISWIQHIDPTLTAY